MNKRNPKPLCLYSVPSHVDPQQYRMEKNHLRGPLLSVTDKATVFGCQRCGAIYWEPFKQTQPRRCHGLAATGERCRRIPQRDSLFCVNHAHLKDRVFEAMTAAIPKPGSADE